MSDSPDINDLVRALRKRERAIPADRFPEESSAFKRPGLYSWWADEDGLAELSTTLEAPLVNPIYGGQAGATRWPSGTPSTATLTSRIRSNHIRGNISSSTFRRTMAAILLSPLGLRLAKPGRLTTESNHQLSSWIEEHLEVLPVPVRDRDILGKIEEDVLSELDPPLNLMGMPSTTVRARLRELRSALGR